MGVFKFPTEPWASLSSHRSLHHRSIASSHHNTLIRRVLEGLRDFSHLRITMEAEQSTTTISAAARFYRLHREEQLAKKKEEYRTRPDVIAKREERERKRAEKAIAKAAKQEEKIKKIQERIMIAEQTRRKFKTIPDPTFLGGEIDSSGLR